jgi:NADH-quinone oxidoreductase subunit M
VIVGALVVGPILAGLLLYFIPRKQWQAATAVAAAIAAITFVLPLTGHAGDLSLRWLARPFEARFHLGFGSVSYWIVLLLSLCTFGGAVTLRGPRARDIAAQLLILQGAMNGVFLAKDLLLFALFWDLMLIPVFLVLVGAGPYARTAWTYLIYNLSGGLALLLATAAFGLLAGTTDVIGNPNAHVAIGMTWGLWIFAGFAFAFLIKTPVFPFHTWMPDTYSDLPAPVVAVVSAVQSKAGLFGFLVIATPFLGAEMAQAKTLMIVLGSVGLIYGALAALAERDAKRIVAYSSLSHLGLILLALFSGSMLAFQGAVVYIIAHGLFSAALFLVLGAIEEREETRDLGRLGGLGGRNPKLAGALTLGALAALGLPGLAGFTGEILILAGLFGVGLVWPAIVALVAIVLAAAYMLRLYQDVMNGPEVPDLPERRDLTWIEALALAPLVAGIVVLGVNPGPVVQNLSPRWVELPRVTSSIGTPEKSHVAGAR